MTRFGIPTLLETASPADCARLCRELRLDFVELNLNFPNFLLHKLDAAQLRYLAREYGIGYTIHLDDEMNAADFNPYVAAACRRTAVEAVELAKAIGAGRINMHLSRGAKYTLPDRVTYFFDAYRRDYLANIRLFRDAVTQAVGDSPVIVCVENTNGFLPFQQEAVELLLESPAFGLTLDVGHNYCSGGADEGWILAHRDRLRHFHIHDARDGHVDHQTLGTGVLEIPRYLKLARELDATVVLETKTCQALVDSVAWLHQEEMI